MARLEGLSAYWNSQSELVQPGDRKPKDMLELLHDYVISDEKKLTHGKGIELNQIDLFTTERLLFVSCFVYILVLGPITSTAKLTLTPSPDRGTAPFSKPKFWIDVIMEELALGKRLTYT